MAHPDSLAVREDSGPRFHCAGDHHLEGVVLTVVRAADLAEAAAHAACTIVTGRTARPAEGLTATLEKLVVAAAQTETDLAHANEALHLGVEPVPGVERQMGERSIPVP